MNEYLCGKMLHIATPLIYTDITGQWNSTYTTGHYEHCRVQD